MAEPVVRGTNFIIGLEGGQTVEGAVRESTESEGTADIEMVRDENNAECAAVVSNTGSRLTISGNMTAEITIKKGEVVTIGTKKYLVEDCKISRGRSVARFTMTLYAPDALTL